MAVRGADAEDRIQAFLDKARTAATIFVGIDPGASGAVGLIGGHVTGVTDIPTYTVGIRATKKTSPKERKATGRKTKRIDGNETRFDYSSICRMFAVLKPVREKVVVALEKVPKSLGPGRHHAEIMLNRAYAMWPLFLTEIRFAFEEITPTEWKKALGLTGKDKEAARHKAISLFPSADIQETSHVDRAEALLIAETLRRRRGDF